MQVFPNELEEVVLLDNSGSPIGSELKSVVHGPDTPLHLAFSVFLFDRSGRMLAQRRALEKATWPGVWSNACCGHPGPGESMGDAIQRRLAYELGLENIDTVLALPGFRYRAKWGDRWENELCPVYVGICDSEPSPNPAEVDSLDWVDWKAFSAACRESDHAAFAHYSPWSLLEGRQLAVSDVLRRFLITKTSLSR